MGIDGRGPAAGFDEEEDAIVGGGQGPATLGVGFGDLDLVGDEHTGEAGFAVVAGLVVVEVVIDRAGGALLGGGKGGEGREEGEEKKEKQAHGKDYTVEGGDLSDKDVRVPTLGKQREILTTDFTDYSDF